jgi:hypothetical protein
MRAVCGDGLILAGVSCWVWRWVRGDWEAREGRYSFGKRGG